MSLPGVPKGQNSVSPYLLVWDGSRLLDFLTKAFGATVEHRMDDPTGAMRHAQVRIGDTVVMVGQTDRDSVMRAMVHVYVADADKTFADALAAGGTSVRELKDEFYGDRSGGVADPFGNVWWIATHVRDVSEAEVAAHFAKKDQ